MYLATTNNVYILILLLIYIIWILLVIWCLMSVIIFAHEVYTLIFLLYIFIKCYVLVQFYPQFEFKFLNDLNSLSYITRPQT